MNNWIVIWKSLQVNCWNFCTIYVFEVRETIADISLDLPCLPHHAWSNPDRLTVPLRYSEVLAINCVLLIIVDFFTNNCFRGQSILCRHSFQLSYHVWWILDYQINFRFKRLLTLLVAHSITDIHSDATMFQWPRKSPEVTRSGCWLTFSTYNYLKLGITVFVGCPEGCRYHTASVVHNVLVSVFSDRNWWNRKTYPPTKAALSSFSPRMSSRKRDPVSTRSAGFFSFSSTELTT